MTFCRRRAWPCVTPATATHRAPKKQPARVSARQALFFGNFVPVRSSSVDRAIVTRTRADLTVPSSSFALHEKTDSLGCRSQISVGSYDRYHPHHSSFDQLDEDLLVGRPDATMSAWFIRNATTVTRPIAVVPSISFARDSRRSDPPRGPGRRWIYWMLARRSAPAFLQRILAPCTSSSRERPE